VKLIDGSEALPANARVAKAYTQGRQVSQASGSINSNPHTAGTPEARAWDNGFRLYTVEGVTLTITATADPEELTGLTYDFSLSATVPAVYHWEDSSGPEFSETGVAKHAFPEWGNYVVEVLVLGEVVATESVSVTYKHIELPRPILLDDTEMDVTAVYTENDAPVAGVMLTPESEDTDVFTVSPALETDENGEAIVTLTRVTDGVASLTVTAPSGLAAIRAVTTTGTPPEEPE